MGDESSDFADAEVDDMFDAEGEADPEQVARRLHEIRAEWAAFASETLDDYDDLSDDEAAVAAAIAGALIDRLAALGTAADTLAEATHEAKAFMDGSPEWTSLDNETRQAATALVDEVIGWLTAEGTLR
jgi:hypothetical protein